jgi:predicted  nucleic acid-binding Zn-ribbon protein
MVKKMSLETEMRNEVVRLEAEIQKINNEIKKLEIQMTQLLTLRKKKETRLKNIEI